jgi:hypothetical protein
MISIYISNLSGIDTLTEVLKIVTDFDIVSVINCYKIFLNPYPQFLCLSWYVPVTKFTDQQYNLLCKEIFT